MACGRPKNLEIAARNLLCSLGDRRRNFPTTRDGNRRRGNPEPPGKGQLRAFGQGEVWRHRQGGNSEPPVRGKPRATRQRTAPGFRARRSLAPRRGGNPGPPGIGQTVGAPGLREARCHRYWADCGASGLGESLVPPGIGQILRPLVSAGARCHPARGEPARGNLEPPAQGELQGMWRRGNPESRAEKKALSRRRRENFKLCGGGETPSCVMRRKL